jgi:hypothetical protein
MNARYFILLVLLAIGVGCQSNIIEYHQDGGLIGARERVTIKPDGSYQTSGRIFGEHQGKLADEQMRRLAGLFSGWSDLKSSYPQSPRVGDAMAYEIRYRGKSVKFTDASQDMPDQLRDIRELMQEWFSPPPTTRTTAPPATQPPR